MSDAATVGGWRDWHDEQEPLRVGVSSCLLGEQVRFDGGHKRDRFVVDVLGPWVEWVPVCPEVEIGMTIPRPSIHLEVGSGAQRLVAPSTGEDFTDRMDAFSGRKLGELDALGLDGYVLKKNSPSCGMERISLYKNGMKGERSGVGLFAARLMERWPHLPVEEEGRLNDPLLRENFVERVTCRNRWRVALRRGLTRNRLVQFHTAHKLLLRAHDEAGYRRLGTLVGSAGSIPDGELFAQYEEEFQTCLRTKASVKKHTNVLQHAMGYLKHVLDSVEKREVNGAIEDFRLGLLPLIVPLTLVRFNMNRHGIEYLQGQLYFDPHPKELMLRNHS
ncbi:MAG: hypothetical protein ACI8QS_000447 [Planctomycetota bacterium]|jgi:uncharacterized protein YbgA (DUF1722 family)/uncharacterized protein YbbK (DUF523 family)